MPLAAVKPESNLSNGAGTLSSEFKPTTPQKIKRKTPYYSMAGLSIATMQTPSPSKSPHRKKNFLSFKRSNVSGAEIQKSLIKIVNEKALPSVPLAEPDHQSLDAPDTRPTITVTSPEPTYASSIDAQPGMYSIINLSATEPFLVYVSMELNSRDQQPTSINPDSRDMKIVKVGNASKFEERSFHTIFVGTRHLLVEVVKKLSYTPMGATPAPAYSSPLRPTVEGPSVSPGDRDNTTRHRRSAPVIEPFALSPLLLRESAASESEPDTTPQRKISPITLTTDLVLDEDANPIEHAKELQSQFPVAGPPSDNEASSSSTSTSHPPPTHTAPLTASRSPRRNRKSRELVGARAPLEVIEEQEGERRLLPECVVQREERGWSFGEALDLLTKEEKEEHVIVPAHEEREPSTSSQANAEASGSLTSPQITITPPSSQPASEPTLSSLSLFPSQSLSSSQELPTSSPGGSSSYSPGGRLIPLPALINTPPASEATKRKWELENFGVGGFAHRHDNRNETLQAAMAAAARVGALADENDHDEDGDDHDEHQDREYRDGNRNAYDDYDYMEEGKIGEQESTPNFLVGSSTYQPYDADDVNKPAEIELHHPRPVAPISFYWYMR